MKNKMILLFGLLPLLVAAQCNPAPLPPPAPLADAAPPEPTPVPTPNPAPSPTVVVDAGPAPKPSTPVTLACANISALNCAAGMLGCEAALQHMVDQKITVVSLPCLTGAKTKAAVRACKTVACP